MSPRIQLAKLMLMSGGDHKRTASTPETSLKALRIMGFTCHSILGGGYVITHPAIPGELVGELNSRLVSKAIVAVIHTAKAMRQSAMDALEVAD